MLKNKGRFVKLFDRTLWAKLLLDTKLAYQDWPIRTGRLELADHQKISYEQQGHLSLRPPLSCELHCVPSRAEREIDEPLLGERPSLILG